jgi:hypothetical protein
MPVTPFTKIDGVLGFIALGVIADAAEDGWRSAIVGEIGHAGGDVRSCRNDGVPASLTGRWFSDRGRVLRGRWPMSWSWVSAPTGTACR